MQKRFLILMGLLTTVGIAGLAHQLLSEPPARPYAIIHQSPSTTTHT